VQDQGPADEVIPAVPSGSSQDEHQNMDLHLQPGSIVCGVDGSPDATRALHWAAAQASLEARPLAVVAAAGLAEPASATIRLQRPELEVLAHSAPGDPRDVLTRLSEHAHLLVLGSRGRGAVRSRLLGSVSASVSRHSHCPLVVCRPESAGRVRRGVLVGVDGTPESRPVLDFAFRTASERELPLTVLHSFHDVLAALNGSHLVATTQERLDEERLLVGESLAGFTEKYPDVHLETLLARGSAEHCLVADSDWWHLIVVGRHPTRTLSRILSPTVATAVLERAHTTVAVVPVPAPAQGR
jgi:nucleotide-binding universal stress UspA family protein